jgi:UDP-N-acetylmuramoyl-tripeptide--D-alanyl-D-alanine ligase
VLTFGLDRSADLWAEELHREPGRQRFRVNGRFDYSLRAPGAHNVSNALAAVGVGLRLGLTHEEIAAALETATPPPMRLDVCAIGAVTLINDAYNANPASMRAALTTVEQLPIAGRRVLVLGDMRELGAASAHFHSELGRSAGRSSAEVILAVGAFARTVADGATSTAGAAKRIYWHPTLETAGPALEGIIRPGDVVLLKGSRAMRLERLISHIERAGMARSSAPDAPDVGSGRLAVPAV